MDSWLIPRNFLTSLQYIYWQIVYDFVTSSITMAIAVCDTSWVLCALLWDTESGSLIIRCMRALDLLYKVKSSWTAFKTSVRHSTK